MLAVVLVLLCISYGYYLNSAISRVVAREAAVDRISDLDARLSELEFSYIALQNSIDINVAYSHNFVDAQPPIFISRNPNDRNLTLVSPQSGL